MANASGKKGAAGTVAQVLTDQGFPAPITGNAAQTAKSVVYVLPGDTGQGALVARPDRERTNHARESHTAHCPD